MAAPMINEAAKAKQQAVQEMATAMSTGTPDGYIKATAILAKLDPEAAKSLIPQMMQLNPELKARLGFAESGASEYAKLVAQSRYSSTPAQLKAMEISQQKEAAKGKLTDKQDIFAQQMFKTVTASQDFKHLQEIRQRAQTIAEFSKNPSAFGDIANVFGFMKSIDPASVVRESEFATASEAGGLLTRAKNILSKAEKGERLTDAQRQDLVRISSHMQSVFDKNYKDYMKPVYKQAEKRGVPVDLIDPFFDAEPSTKIAPGTVASSSSQKAVQIQGTSIKAPVGAKVRSKSTGKIMTVQPDGSLK